MNSQLFWIAGSTVLALLLWHFVRRPPPPSTSVEPWVIEAFRQKTRKQWLLGIPVGLLAIFSYWLRAYPSAGGAVLLPVMVLVVAWCCYFSYRNWRCPKCDAYLGKYAWQICLADRRLPEVRDSFA